MSERSNDKRVLRRSQKRATLPLIGSSALSCASKSVAAKLECRDELDDA